MRSQRIAGVAVALVAFVGGASSARAEWPPIPIQGPPAELPARVLAQCQELAKRRPVNARKRLSAEALRALEGSTESVPDGEATQVSRARKEAAAAGDATTSDLLLRCQRADPQVYLALVRQPYDERLLRRVVGSMVSGSPQTKSAAWAGIRGGSAVWFLPVLMHFLSEEGDSEQRECLCDAIRNMLIHNGAPYRHVAVRASLLDKVFPPEDSPAELRERRRKFLSWWRQHGEAYVSGELTPLPDLVTKSYAFSGHYHLDY